MVDILRVGGGGAAQSIAADKHFWVAGLKGEHVNRENTLLIHAQVRGSARGGSDANEDRIEHFA